MKLESLVLSRDIELFQVPSPKENCLGQANSPCKQALGIAWGLLFFSSLLGLQRPAALDPNSLEQGEPSSVPFPAMIWSSGPTWAKGCQGKPWNQPDLGQHSFDTGVRQSSDDSLLFYFLICLFVLTAIRGGGGVWVTPGDAQGSLLAVLGGP